MRCFVALKIDGHARASLPRLSEELFGLPRGAARKVRVVPAANLHVTVKFLGDLHEEGIPSLQQALGQVAARMAPPAAELQGVGAFPSMERPRVIFAMACKGKAALIELAKQVEGACAELGFAEEQKGHVPHVTLARVDRARAGGPLTTWLENVKPRVFGTVDAQALVLFESRLRPNGPSYRPLCLLPFLAR